MEKIIKKSRYRETKSSYEYLLGDPEKFKYLQTHSSTEYLKRFWTSSTGGVNPLCTAFKLYSNVKKEQFINLFEEVNNLFKGSIPCELEERLWRTAVNAYESPKKNVIDPLIILKQKLSIESYFAQIKSDIGVFFEFCCNEDTPHFIDFFYQQLVKLKSDKELTTLLTDDLKCPYGYYYNKTLLDILNSMDTKPVVFKQINALYIKADLLKNTEKLLNNERFCYINSAIQYYIAEFISNPKEITPLSQLRLENTDPSSQFIVDIVMERGTQKDKDELNKALEQEQNILSKQKEYNPLFFQNKSTIDLDEPNVELDKDNKPDLPSFSD